MQFPASIAVFRETAAVPFEIRLDTEICFLQRLPRLEVGECSCCPLDMRLQPANQPAIDIMRLTFCIFDFRNSIVEAFDLADMKEMQNVILTHQLFSYVPATHCIFSPMGFLTSSAERITRST